MRLPFIFVCATGGFSGNEAGKALFYAFVEDEPIEMPISSELDLHTFRPKEVKQLLPDYFEACLEKGIFQVRVIHGKGTGALRELVHAQLKKLPMVESFELGDQTSGSWGATRVRLKSPSPPGEE